MTINERDSKYLSIFLKRLEVCKQYRPRFGQGQLRGLSEQAFQELYGADPFYKWIGLDISLMYIAHRAAGGITSVYRQIGTACEEIFRQVVQDELGLDESQSRWAYTTTTSSGRTRTLTLDGRIQIEDVIDPAQRARITQWIEAACNQIGVDPKISSGMKGAVFEVRQGYKSKDSKRQQADLANAATAYVHAYLPVVVLFSTQIDTDILYRYEHERWLVLRGLLNGSTTQSAYIFMRDVIGYDLAGFFTRNSQVIRASLGDVLTMLLSSDETFSS
jgi:hypothetical protein